MGKGEGDLGGPAHKRLRSTHTNLSPTGAYVVGTGQAEGRAESWRGETEVALEGEGSSSAGVAFIPPIALSPLEPAYAECSAFRVGDDTHVWPAATAPGRLSSWS